MPDARHLNRMILKRASLLVLLLAGPLGCGGSGGHDADGGAAAGGSSGNGGSGGGSKDAGVGGSGGAGGGQGGGGIGGAGATGGTGVDAGVDAKTDASADTDVGANTDAKTDAGADASIDAGVDAVLDTPPVDAIDAVDTVDAVDAVDGAGSADAGADGAGRPGIMVVATYLGGISTFTLDPTTGAPHAATASPVDPDAQFYSVAAAPSGSFVYAADFRGRIYGYRVSRADGSLAPVPSSPLVTGGQAVTAAVDPQGHLLYVTNNGDNSIYAFTIDGTSGALTPVLGSPFTLGAAPVGVAFHPTAALVYVSSTALSAAGGGGIHGFSFDRTTGVPQELTSSPFVTTIFGGQLVMHPSGKFMYDGAFGLHAFSVDSTGTVSELSGSPHPGSNSDNTAVDVAVDPRGQYLYASDNLGTVTAYSIDATGAFGDVPHSPFDARPTPYSLAVDPAGGFVYVGNDDANQVSMFPLDRATGSLDVTAGSTFTVHGAQPEIVILAP